MVRISLRNPLTIVITLEGLSAASLGCYGCSWNQTPVIDSFAGHGVVWDRWTAHCDFDRGEIQSCLTAASRLMETLPARGSSVLVCDDDRLDLEGITAFDSVVHVSSEPPEKIAENLEQCRFAKTVATAIDQVQSETGLLWLHSRALVDFWDVPHHPVEVLESSEPVEFAEEQTDAAAGDSALPPYRLPDEVQVPAIELTPNDHPDLLFTWMQRYAEVVAAVDELIGVMADATAARRPTIIVAGVSGFSLGENGWIGHRVGPLRSPDIRLPMIVSAGGPLRVPGLTSTEAFAEILSRIADRKPPLDPAQWCQGDEPLEPALETRSDRAERAVTTAAWFYVRDSESMGRERLYLKPDDLADINDVSRLRREVVDALSQV